MTADTPADIQFTTPLSQRITLLIINLYQAPLSLSDKKNGAIKVKITITNDNNYSYYITNTIPQCSVIITKHIYIHSFQCNMFIGIIVQDTILQQVPHQCQIMKKTSDTMVCT